MKPARYSAFVASVALLVASSACSSATRHGSSPSTTAPRRELPARVDVRAQPQGITLADPAFDALPGARADFGRLGGSVYRIEMPNEWNGRLVLFMHGFEELGPIAHVTAPDFRRYLIGHGFAWGASSFSSTSLIPGRSADETAALWDSFVRKYGRPKRTYVTGLSMGGMATNIAAERYPDRFDGALALCGSAGQTAAVQADANFFVAGAYVAGVTQAEFDASHNVGRLIRDRILPALGDPAQHAQFENIMIDLTGGPRAFDREGFHAEEATNWRRAEWLVAAQIAPNRDTVYTLGPSSHVSSAAFNRAVIRLPVNEDGLRRFVQGDDTTGALRMPLLTMHTTGDGQVPIDQARILGQRVAAAGKSDLLVQQVIRDPSHCGFTTDETEAALRALVAWVEHGVKPPGTNVMVRDLTHLDRTFERSPRAGTSQADALPGRRARAVLRGQLTLDGAPFSAQFLGAAVLRNGLLTPCQGSLPPVSAGRYEIAVLAAAEGSGCGAADARIVLWTFAHDTILFSHDAAPWPGDGKTTAFATSFSSTAPGGVAHPTSEFAGEIFDTGGQRLPPGTRVEAFVGGTRCGIASVRRSGNFSGFSLDVVGPESIPGCTRGKRLTFRVNGRRAPETAVNQPNANTSLDLTYR